MSNNFNENVVKNIKKTKISDTGSRIYAENQAISLENSEIKAKSEDFSPKTDANTLNPLKTQPNSSINRQSDASNVKNSPENNEISRGEPTSDPKASENNENKPENSYSNEKSSSSSRESDIAPNKASDLVHFFNEASENELKSSFPSVNVAELKKNKEFGSLLRIILKNPSLSDIYACYSSIISQTEEISRQRLAQALANADSSVGSLASTEQGSAVYFTKEQVLKMSPEQIKKNYQQIRESQGKW